MDAERRRVDRPGRPGRPSRCGRAGGAGWPAWVGCAGAVLAAVALLPWWLGAGGDTLVHPGFALDALGVHGTWVGLLAVAVACLAGAARAWRAHGRTALTGVVLLVVTAVVVALAAASFGVITSLSDPLGRQYSRFDAPDGTAYLLYADDRESGRFAVYEGGPVVWHAVRSVGDDGSVYGTPGALPCRGRATATQVVVSCTGGRGPFTYPR